MFLWTIHAAENSAMRPSNIKVDTTLSISRATQEYVINMINKVEYNNRYDEMSRQIINLTQFSKGNASPEQKKSIDEIMPYLKKIQAQLKSEQKNKIPVKVPVKVPTKIPVKVPVKVPVKTWNSAWTYYTLTQTWYILGNKDNWPKTFWSYTLQGIDTSMGMKWKQAMGVTYAYGKDLFAIMLGDLSTKEIQDFKSKGRKISYNWNTFYVLESGWEILCVLFRDKKVNTLLFMAEVRNQNTNILDNRWDGKLFLDWAVKSL
jgi:hypothetical protein